MLTGEGQKENLKAQIEPFGSAEQFIDYLRAKAALNWNGQQPQIIAGSGAAANLIVPIPQLAGAGTPATKASQ